MDPGQDVRGREVRARLLGPRTMKRFALLAAVAAGLAPAPAQPAPGAPTGRLLVLLDRPHHGARAVAAAARLAGHSVPQIGLVTVRPRPGERLSALAARLRA